jgi:hypothetical protein
MIKTIESKELQKVFKSGFEYLQRNYHILDNLNVFPIPDGDTGVNMMFTLKSGIDSLDEHTSNTMKNFAEILNKSVTNNSRGNSGFILARFFHGFTEIIKKNETLTPEILAQAFGNGSYLSKTSLSTPMEGTMITILASCAESMSKNKTDDIVVFLKEALAASRESLKNTPKLLPILAKAGVIDSGALGFIFFLEGMIRSLTGEKIIMEDEADYRFEPDLTISDEVLKHLPFRYCTEILVEYKTEPEILNFKSMLESHGDCVALLCEDGIIKLHIHTNEPDLIQNEAGKFGEIVKIKIDDMQEQVNQTFSAIKKHEDLTVLAIIPGPGFERIYKDFGAQHFINYSENLPSLSEILDEIKKIKCNNIIILPNDKNIIPVATLVKDQSEKNIYILPTKNIVQGLAAMYSFSDMDSTEHNVESMADSLKFASCLKIYKSSRNSSYGNVNIKENDYFTVDGDDVLSSEPALDGAFISALKKIDLSEKASITLYYNEDFDNSIIPSLQEKVSELNSNITLESYFGGQKKSVLIISVE